MTILNVMYASVTYLNTNHWRDSSHCSPITSHLFLWIHVTKGDQSWVFIGRTDAEAKIPILWPPHVKSWLIGKNPDAEGLGARGEGDDRGWDGWMASLTQWTWVWVNSRSWWWTGRPGMLRFSGSQRVKHDWGTELNWTVSTWKIKCTKGPLFSSMQVLFPGS